MHENDVERYVYARNSRYDSSADNNNSKWKKGKWVKHAGER